MKSFAGMTLLMALVLSLFGCSALKVPQGISQGNEMVETRQLPDSVVYVNQAIDQVKYTRFILEPVAVHTGEGADFGKIPREEIEMMAGFIGEAFREAFAGSQFLLTEQPSAETLRVKFTLIGLTRSVPVVQGLNYAMFPVGTGIQLTKGLLGKSGTFMGNAAFAVEFTDSITGEVAASLVTKQSASALNFAAAVSGKYASAQAGIRDFMTTMRKRADDQHGFK